MAASNSVLNVVSLDRPTLRADLIAFLKGKPIFQDYDFEGSNLSLLIDLLAYNTNKEAFLTNMLFSEAFMSSAQLMSSVVSHANELNYTARSARSATANVTVTFNATGQNQPYIIPKGSSFSTLVKNTQYVFTIPETLVVSSANNSYSFSTQIAEGEYFKDGYQYVSTDDEPFPRFLITNPNIDTTSLTVVVFEDDSVLGDPYVLKNSLLDLTDRSKVFFLQQTSDGLYEVLFGDGIVGHQPAQGATVILDYRVTVADKANSATRFAINFDPTGAFGESSNVVVTTTQIAIGGAPPETMSSIKYYAPRWYQTQERATAAPDYETLLKTNFPEIQAATAYGGEDANPPLYGRIVVSIALAGLTTLPSSKQQQYSQFLEPRMPLGMLPVFVDALFTYINVDTLVKYDTSVTANTPQRIESLVSAVITDWNATNLGDFETTLLYSPFCTAIDKADPSIISDSTTITPYKKINPTLTQASSFVLDFQMPLVSDLAPIQYPHAASLETTISSTAFSYQGQLVDLEDDGQGKINIVLNTSGVITNVINVGTVDYANGIVTLNLTIDAYQGDAIRVYARSAQRDIASSKNTILTIEASGINVIAKPNNTQAAS